MKDIKIREQYVDAKIGDRVVKYYFLNTTPNITGIVTATSKHFVEIEIEGSGLFFGKMTKCMVSKADIEVLT